MEPIDCLPEALRAQAPQIARVTAGLSGAGVYRVDAGGASYILKVGLGISGLTRDAWRARVRAQQAAGEAGVAPRVVHVDDDRIAILMELVVDRGFGPWLMSPATRATAIAELARTLRRVHALPIPAGAPRVDGPPMLARFVREIGADLPRAAAPAVQGVVDEVAPPRDRPDVLGHNDVNPTNIVFDGEHAILLDWDNAGPNDPFFDLAALAVFMRFDEPSCRALIAAYDGAPCDELPARFRYCRRIVAAACGCIFLRLAKQQGYTHDGTGISLADCYAKMRAGELSPASPTGQWQLGMGLIGELAGL
jgi:aminoglycoside phosphotransferase (APT) family kinase protein|nr:phosphotransferase [Kofleriaceae bacterium]